MRSTKLTNLPPEMLGEILARLNAPDRDKFGLTSRRMRAEANRVTKNLTNKQVAAVRKVRAGRQAALARTMVRLLRRLFLELRRRNYKHTPGTTDLRVPGSKFKLEGFIRGGKHVMGPNLIYMNLRVYDARHKYTELLADLEYQWDFVGDSFKVIRVASFDSMLNYSTRNRYSRDVDKYELAAHQAMKAYNEHPVRHLSATTKHVLIPGKNAPFNVLRPKNRTPRSMANRIANSSRHPAVMLR